MAVYIGDAISHAFFQFIEYGVNFLAMRTLVIPIFHQHNRRVQ
jgi:hypothetical protein